MQGIILVDGAEGCNSGVVTKREGSQIPLPIRAMQEPGHLEAASDNFVYDLKTHNSWMRLGQKFCLRTYLGGCGRLRRGCRM